METVKTHYEAHYTSGNLKDRVQGMLEAAGTPLDSVTPEQMAAFDQFHVRGVQATKELADLAGFPKEGRILDVGSGIGGPARFLNRTVGCKVTGIDLTTEFVDTAKWLTSAQGQQGGVDFVQGSALEMPFDDATFDGAWMQHVNMNIEDKPGLFKEIARVLKPGAKFVFHEALADKADQPYFPVPWSRTPEGSHLAHEPEFRQALESAGFEVAVWQDETQKSIEWFNEFFARVQSQGPPPINVGVLLGPEFPQMGLNANKSMEDGLIRLVIGVAKKA